MDLTCEEAKMTPTAREAQMEEERTLALGEQMGWKQCGHCHRLVSRDFGCNHMTVRGKLEKDADLARAPCPKLPFSLLRSVNAATSSATCARLRGTRARVVRGKSTSYRMQCESASSKHRITRRIASTPLKHELRRRLQNVIFAVMLAADMVTGEKSTFAETARRAAAGSASTMRIDAGIATRMSAMFAASIACDELRSGLESSKH